MEDDIGVNKDATLNEKFEVNIKGPIRKGNGGICEIDEFGVEKFNSDVVINILNLKEGRNDDISLGKKAEISEDIYRNCEEYNLPKFEKLVREMSWEIEKSLIIHSSEEHNEDPDIDEKFDVDANADEFSVDGYYNVGESNIDGYFDTNGDDWWNEDSNIDDFDGDVD